MAEEEPKENALLTSIKLRIGIEDTKQDALLLDLIEDASSRVLAYINQDGPTTDDLPSSLGWVVKAVAIEMYNRIGDEARPAAPRVACPIHGPLLIFHSTLMHSTSTAVQASGGGQE
ncbi:phage head-tail connector protein [Lacticaseibacillus nasuensis]|uniref:phage head-tail connector protein n=1 Tax=Lacticaseibacillus nasuensis TaxID=944671 RepID=UPI000AF872E5|nr:phage head-tail connector protein [Lacticaseibacillus nasuensis]